MSLSTNPRGDHPIAIARIACENPDLNNKVVYFNEDVKKGNDTVFLEGATDTIRILPLYDEKEDQIDRFYIFATAGAGKSTVIADILKSYKQMFPDNNIFMYSGKPESDEKAFKDLDIEYVDLADLKAMPIPAHDQTDYENCVVIFDDVNSIPDKILLEKVVKTRDTLLTVGRSRQITVLSTAHKALESRLSNRVITTATKVIMFKKTIASENEKFMSKKLGMSKAHVERILDLLEDNSWVCLSTNNPLYYITSKEIGLLKRERSK